MSWAHFFAISILLLFALQGIYFFVNKKMYVFKESLNPVVLACFLALMMTIIQVGLRKSGVI